MEILDYLIKEIKSLDIKNISAEYIFQNIVNKSIKKIQKIKSSINPPPELPKEIKITLEASQQEIIEQILFNIKFAKNWASSVNFQDLQSQKSLNKVYVNLDFYLTPSVNQYGISEEERLSLKKALKLESTSYLILGGPGAGKTTLTKYIVNQLLNGKKLFNIEFSCPIVIRLKEVSSTLHKQNINIDSLYFILIEFLGIKIDYDQNLTKFNSKQIDSITDFYYSIIKRVVTNFLDEGRFLLILDGFDEISSYSLKETIKEEITTLTTSLEYSRVLLTSRTGEIYLATEKMQMREICPLNKQQIRDFTNKYIKDKNDAENLILKIIQSPFHDAAMRPINLAHLCAIYERYKDIPEKPKSVYKKIVNLLLEEWDTQRGIVRPTKYAGFSNDRKIDFLSRLSYELTTKYNRFSFTKKEFSDIYFDIASNFQLPLNEGRKVVKEVESHNGLFIQTGYETYEFSHKSLQEFLCAEFMIKSPLLRLDKHTLLNMPNELAIATGLSALPGHYMAEFLMNKLSFHSENINFIYPFLERLKLEKPDYESSNFLGTSFIYLHSIVIELLKSSGDYKYTKQDKIITLSKKSSYLYETDGLYESYFSNLIQHPNISESLKKIKREVKIPNQIRTQFDILAENNDKNHNKLIVFEIDFEVLSNYSSRRMNGYVNMFMLNILLK